MRRIVRYNKSKIRGRSDFSKKYSLDDKFFEKIDTEAKAYFLGWLYADGCVYQNHKGSYFCIQLQKSDRQMLEMFQEFLKTNAPIHDQKNRNTSGLFIWSKKMFYDLVSLGCVPRKSLILKFPTESQVPKEMFRHFIRGFFDGDGGITFNKKNARAEVKLTSSLEFCNQLSELLTKNDLVNKIYTHPIIISKHERLPYTSISFGNMESIRNFYTYIYHEATFFLPRKKDKFHVYFKHLKDVDNGLTMNRGYEYIKLYNEDTQKTIEMTNISRDSANHGFGRGSIYDLINKRIESHKGYKILELRKLNNE